jgi:AraC-like DNA-binding protein
LNLAGLDAERFDRGEGTIRRSELDSFLDAAYRVSGRADLGFELGRLTQINSHDMLGYGLISCRDVDHFLRLASRYFHAMNEMFNLRYHRRLDQGEAVFSPVVAMQPETMHFLLEVLAVTTYHHLHSFLGGDARMLDIRLSMAPPAHHLRYVELSAANFHFDESATPGVSVRIAGALLDRPLPMAAPRVVEQIEQQMQMLQRRAVPDAEWGPYITMLLRNAEGRQLTLDDIAASLNVSVRTIDRHLKKERLQFRDLSQQVRFERARDLLAMPGASTASVAAQLGFSDASNFSRGFRRHWDMTPSDFQLKARQSTQGPGVTDVLPSSLPSSASSD